jgi:hypothetical protein
MGEGDSMRENETFEKKQLIELLNKCWMTHDGMWFYSCLNEYGMAAANKLNKSAIRLLAPIEVGRMKKYYGLDKDRIETFDEFKAFFSRTRELFIPDFMNAAINFPATNIMRWEFGPDGCFAYKGMNAIGAIKEYDCGVLYRIECWLKSLGVPYRADPEIHTCLMLDKGSCSGEFILDLED